MSQGNRPPAQAPRQDPAVEPGHGWRFAIDRGGTFTDLVGRGPTGQRLVRKVLSEQPEHPGDPALRALRESLGLAPRQPLPPGWVDEVRIGTTVVTNALLERKVQPVLLLLNAGLEDLPWIGDQHRPDIFALRIQRPEPLPIRVVSVPGRLAADGAELEPLQLDGELAGRLMAALAELEERGGCAGVAVALLHSCRNGSHERALGDWLHQRLALPVLLSHEVSPQPRLVPRLHTTVAETALRPVLHRYLDQLRQELGPHPRLRVMGSSGALLAPELLQARDTILSGPAGGMVGALAVAAAAGFEQRPILGFDMGGTSTDVFYAAAAADDLTPERLSETGIDGLRLQVAMLPIHTVAAGGGSVLHVEDQRLQVGPASAGADPGPACYRRGGPATITDANLLLGRLPVAALPSVFGPAGDQGVDGEVVRRRFAALALALGLDPDAPLSLERLAAGALAIAIERMAEAIRRVSIQRGHDIREAVLVCYGGAGGQHACALADSLGLTRVLVHPLAGVLSAHGIGLARERLRREEHLGLPLADAALARLRQRQQALTEEAVAALHAAGRPPLPGEGDPLPAGATTTTGATPPTQGAMVCRVSLELRLAGGERGLELPWSGESAAELASAFQERHQRCFGYAVPGEALTLERLTLEVSLPEPVGSDQALASPEREGTPPQGSHPLHLHSGDRVPLCLSDREGAGQMGGLRWRRVPLWRREQLGPGQVLCGPALLLDATGTLLLEPGWQGRLLPDGALLLEQRQACQTMPTASPATADPSADPTSPRARPFRSEESPPQLAANPAELEPVDPVRLELYNHRFSAIAQQMGERLRQSSRSLNIRERLDFSCALFDGKGALVANAPHIPVHLGSMGDSVAALLAAISRGERPPLRPGDAIAANDPYNGGTHLPDITVITPVFRETAEAAAMGPAGSRLAPDLFAEVETPLFYVASRGHHADVGGITPGSMPAFSRSIAEEGLLLDNVPLLSAGVFDALTWRQRLGHGPHPVRNPEQLLADLQAQLAANQLGVAELQRLLRLHGRAEVQLYMGHVQANAAEAVREVIDRLRDGSHVVERDDGSRIEVAVRLDRSQRRVRIDFSGTSPQLAGNANAPLAITRAVVLYVFRCLVGRPIPLNAGCFEPIDLVVPAGSLLAPSPPAAVVAGNVETSQAIANALFGALGVQAAAQGTMNNLSFGNRHCQYYETLGGGSGAGRDLDGQGFAGASGVQCHMTNSRLTDPEILEQRSPVRLQRFALRHQSGGAGRWDGGDGLERQLLFLEPISVALLSDNRRVPPAGLAGGAAGCCGENRLDRADGSSRTLEGCCQFEAEPGDQLTILSPGGGGYGPPNTLGPSGGPSPLSNNP